MVNNFSLNLLKELKEQCLHSFTKGIHHEPKELAEMVVLIENQIYLLANVLIQEIEQTKKEGK